MRDSSRESKGRTDPAYCRRDTEEQKKAYSSGGSSDYSQNGARGWEREASGELLQDRLEDLDQEFDLIYIDQLDDDRPELDSVTSNLLDTLQHLLVVSRRKLTSLSEHPRRNRDNSLRYQVLIDKEVLNIKRLEAGINKLLEDNR